MYQQDPYLLGVDEQQNGHGYSGIQSNQQIQNVAHLQQQQQQQMLHHQQHSLLHGVPQHMAQPMVHHPFAMHPQVAHAYGQQMIQQQYSSSQAQGMHISHNLALPVVPGNDNFAESGDEEKADSVANSELAVGGSGFLSDPRLSVFRKLHRTLTSSLLIKSWQRLAIVVAGMEAVQEHGQASLTTLEKAIYFRFHGDSNCIPPYIGTARRMVDDNLSVLATEQYGIKFPKDKILYTSLVNNLPGHILWRYYKELVSEICVKINGVYRTCLNHDLSFPEGKTLYDVLEETLQLLWVQNEDTRRDRLKKRSRQSSGDGNEAGYVNNDDESEDGGDPNNNNNRVTFDQPMTAEGEGGDQPAQSGRKAARPKQQITYLLTPKDFPGVGKYQPFSFLSFLLLGPPAGDKCWSRFALERNPESAPRRPRLTSTVVPMDTSVDGYHHPPPPVLPQSKRRRESEEDNDAIRVFNAETAARAQRLEELKLALSLFPDDDSIKVELKQFIDSQRRTMLSSDALASTGFQPLMK